MQPTRTRVRVGFPHCIYVPPSSNTSIQLLAVHLSLTYGNKAPNQIQHFGILFYPILVQYYFKNERFVLLVQHQYLPNNSDISCATTDATNFLMLPQLLIQLFKCL
jgi:hypothetical protein